MKKIIITAFFLALSLGAMAQQNSQQPNGDHSQQQAPTTTQINTERSAAQEDQKKENEVKTKVAAVNERSKPMKMKKHRRHNTKMKTTT